MVKQQQGKAQMILTATHSYKILMIYQAISDVNKSTVKTTALPILKASESINF